MPLRNKINFEKNERKKMVDNHHVHHFVCVLYSSSLFIYTRISLYINCVRCSLFRVYDYDALMPSSFNFHYHFIALINSQWYYVRCVSVSVCVCVCVLCICIKLCPYFSVEAFSAIVDFKCAR